jgi:hypothetical protein
MVFLTARPCSPVGTATSAEIPTRRRLAAAPRVPDARSVRQIAVPLRRVGVGDLAEPSRTITPVEDSLTDDDPPQI